MQINFRSMIERMRQRYNTKKTIEALSKLNDRDLADIGIHRSQITSIATEVLKVHREERDK